MGKCVLGIDFGTTKTMAAWVNPKTGHHEVINLGEEHNYIPTTVYVEDDERLLFGEAADDSAVMQPDRYCRGFKMKLGTGAPALMVFNAGKPQTYTARRLTALFLKHVKELCERKAVFETVDSVVITRPVNFSPAQEEELREAAEEAGFTDICFITEPEAAGFAFCALSPEVAFSNKALIVDWGGGTLDMAVVERSGEKVKLSGEHTAGDNNMGGEAYDSFLWDYACAAVPSLLGESRAGQYAAQAQLRKTKEVLSKRENRRVQFSLSSGVQELNVKRADFENLIKETVGKAALQAKKLLDNSSRQEIAPEMLLLVGGTSRIPLIQRQMATDTGLPAREWQFAREAVAIGAALWQNQESKPDAEAAKADDPQKPVESEPCLEYGDIYLYGLNGNARDFLSAVQWYAKGYEDAGDLNCLFALYDAYFNGFGVPRDYAVCFFQANRMLERGCPIGYYMQGCLFARGKGVPLDAEKAGECFGKVLEECRQPLPGINEELRLLVLGLSASALGRHDEALRWLRLYAQQEKAKFKSSALAMAMIRSGCTASPEDKAQLRQLLEEGCLANEAAAMWLKGKLLASGEGGWYARDAVMGFKLVSEAAERLPLPVFLLTKAMMSRSDADFDRFWKAAQYGVSNMLSEISLNCDIRLCPNEAGTAVHVYEKGVAASLLEQNHGDEIRNANLAPRIVIRNNSPDNIPFFRLRVCIPDRGVDKTVDIRESIAPHQEVSVNVDAYDVPLGENMRIEVEANGKVTSLDFSDFLDLGVYDLAAQGAQVPPFVLAWETSGFFSSHRQLIICCLEGEFPNLVVTKESGARTNVPAHLVRGGTLWVGKNDFSDSRELMENEKFYVSSNGNTILCGRIKVTTQDGTNSDAFNRLMTGMPPKGMPSMSAQDDPFARLASLWNTNAHK